jgi:hypothetical protein
VLVPDKDDHHTGLPRLFYERNKSVNRTLYVLQRNSHLTKGALLIAIIVLDIDHEQATFFWFQF